MATRSLDTFSTLSELSVGSRTFRYFSLPKFAERTGMDIARMPYALRILLGDGGSRGAGDRILARARSVAGLHRRPRRGGPGGHA